MRQHAASRRPRGGKDKEDVENQMKSRGRRRCAAAAAWVAAWRKERLEASGLVDFFSTTSGRSATTCSRFQSAKVQASRCNPTPQARGCGRKSASRNWTALFRASDWGRAMSSPVRWGQFITTLSVQRRVPLSQALGPGLYRWWSHRQPPFSWSLHPLPQASSASSCSVILSLSLPALCCSPAPRRPQVLGIDFILSVDPVPSFLQSEQSVQSFR